MLEQRESSIKSTAYGHSQGPVAVGEARATGEKAKLPGTCRSNRGGPLRLTSIHSSSAWKLRWLPVALLVGCGTLLRAEVGPTFIEGTGPGATAQISAGISPLAGAGLFEMMVVGGYGTLTTDGPAGGLRVAIEFGVAPGGFDADRHLEERSGLGWHARVTSPRAGTDGVAIGGGAGLTSGTGRRTDGGGSISFGDHEKCCGSIRWGERRWINWLVAVDVQHTLVDEQLDRGVWRVDGFLGIERMVLTD